MAKESKFLQQLPKSTWEDHVALAKTIREVGRRGKDFVKLRSIVWVQEEVVAKSLMEVGSKILKYDYRVTGQKFLEIPTFVQIDIGQDVWVRSFQLFIESGIVELWNGVKSASLYRSNIQFWKETAGLDNLIDGTGNENGDCAVGNINLENSLLLEGFILLGIGVATAMVVRIQQNILQTKAKIKGKVYQLEA